MYQYRIVLPSARVSLMDDSVCLGPIYVQQGMPHEVPRSQSTVQKMTATKSYPQKTATPLPLPVQLKRNMSLSIVPPPPSQQP